MLYRLSRNEKTLIYSKDNIDGLPLPDIIFASKYKFKTSCLLMQYDGSQTDCQSYLSSPKLNINRPDRPGWITSFTAQNIKFLDPAGNHYNRSVVRRINFEFNISDELYLTNADAGMWAILSNSESNIVSQSSSIHVTSDVNSTVYASIYNLGKSQQNVFKIEWTIHKFIIQSALNVVFGLAHFTTLPMLTVTYATNPIVNNNNVYARVSVEPSSYMVKTETEKSDMTLFSVLSVLGGDRAIDPWGCVQRTQLKRIGFRKSVIDQLANIAYWATDRGTALKGGKSKPTYTIDKDIESGKENSISGSKEKSIISANTEGDTDDENEEEWTMKKLRCKFKTMQKRQKALENFLQDYVVDMTFYINNNHYKQDKKTDSNKE
ncbi:6128_t:CDS:2 [Paraglomus occultum]|uniref:6128_t:CDS:1 n=1 Tax=Paraglomus occultum TaxID=144539 RepID=A0A9N9BPA5_9GLOM|nr:6128_t:CDS:2 [Paraglomus occultum]